MLDAENMSGTLKFKIVGENKMRCGGCEGGVRFVLSQVPGVTEVRADHKTQLIEVEVGADPVDEKLLADQLEMTGYQVEAVPE